MANKGLDRKAAAVGVEGKRMLILDQEKCKPQMPAHDFLKRIARSCGRDCITMNEQKRIQILEDACLACLNRAKQCPGDAVKIIKLPSNLQTDVTHKCATPSSCATPTPTPTPTATATPNPTSTPKPNPYRQLEPLTRYGMNAFKLHGLPTPRPGSVLGLQPSRLTLPWRCHSSLAWRCHSSLAWRCHSSLAWRYHSSLAWPVEADSPGTWLRRARRTSAEPLGAQREAAVRGLEC